MKLGLTGDTTSWINYALRGITPVQYQLSVYGKRISSIGVLTTEGIEDVYIVEGNVNGAIFLQFIQRCLLNIIKPFDGSNSKSVVIFDNASIHHLSSVVDIITAAGALVRFLPPYSPDLNPIEEAKLRHTLETISVHITAQTTHD